MLVNRIKKRCIISLHLKLKDYEKAPPPSNGGLSTSQLKL
jgi:hypothetical protein